MNILNAYLTGKNRPKKLRTKTTKIAIHYVGNAGSTASANRNYFNTTSVDVSANYIIGLLGEVICCIPDEEIAWCTNTANSYSVSIECCHEKTDGVLNAKTYASLVELTVMLLKKYKLKETDIVRHFDVTGKVCPKGFVPKSKGGSDDEKNTAYKQFKADVKKGLAEGEAKTTEPTVKETTVKVKYLPKCDKGITSIVDGLKNVKVSSSYAYRAKLAVKNGMCKTAKEYDDTKVNYNCNVAMLNYLKIGKLIKA